MADRKQKLHVDTVKMNKIIIYFVLLHPFCECAQSSTASQRERIKALSRILKADIKPDSSSGRDVALFEDVDAEYDIPLTPIGKTTITYRTEEPSGGDTTYSKRKEKRHRRPRVLRDHKEEEPTLIYYRRNIDTSLFNEEFKSAHCVDLITPYLTGTWNVSKVRFITENDTIVRRLAELLNVNTTGYSREDIHIIMTHINKMKIRLFQWDSPALKQLFNSITNVEVSTFRKIQRGLLSIFQRWNMEISDIARLLKEMRIFRPPCIPMQTEPMSTKEGKISTYPKMTTKTQRVHCDDF